MNRNKRSFRPVCLIIVDGFGVAADSRVNAVDMADTPHLDQYFSRYPHTTLRAAGLAVGLPDGQMGNSEVGHLNIGAGRVVYQDLTRISLAIEDGSFADNPVLRTAVGRLQSGTGALHLLGLVSDGGVHSSNTHLYALLRLAAEQGLQRVFIHPFLDGRDTPPRSALTYIRALEEVCADLGVGTIATVCGRYYAMDRDNRWERLKQAYDALVRECGERAGSAEGAVRAAYARGENDEFVKPTIIDDANGSIKDGDSVIFFNFRADRARQLTEAMTDPDFSGFDRGSDMLKIHFVCFTEYDARWSLPVAFAADRVVNSLSEVIAAAGLRQLHLAETEKYAHVTFFFNGGVEAPVEGEERILVPSPKVSTYDLQPEMSAPAVAEEAVAAVNADRYDFIVINFANCDMVGHTGMSDAAVKAIEAVDRAVGSVVEAVQERGGAVVITADHGNAEKMVDNDGLPWTAHTLNKVPLILVGDGVPSLKEGDKLADIAPTILSLLDLRVPSEMTGKSLLR